MKHCLDELDLKPVLAFLTPIFNPEKPIRISLTLATVTIVVSLDEIVLINWSKMLFDCLHSQLELQCTRMKNQSLQFSHLPSYIAHLY